MTKTPKKSLYILPNLFTVASIFCAFLAIIQAFNGQGVEDMYRAAMLIGISMILDASDGRVARITNTQSEFGVQLDSLADVVAFGVAPAVLIYQWALTDLGFFGVFAAFAFIACGALRLARFNVQAASEDSPGCSKYFTGLPIPIAAGLPAALVLLQAGRGFYRAPDALVIPIAMMMLLLGFLMVSTVKYKTFKDFSLKNMRNRALLGTVVAMIVVMSVTWTFSLALVSGLLVYIGYGVLHAAASVASRGIRLARGHQD